MCGAQAESPSVDCREAGRTPGGDWLSAELKDWALKEGEDETMPLPLKSPPV